MLALLIGFRLLAMLLFSIDNSLTNKGKTAIFEVLRLFWEFFGHFFVRFPKFLNIIISSVQGH